MVSVNEMDVKLYRRSAQLANISARITMHELLKLSKSTRKALRKALSDAEAFMAQIPADLQQEDLESLHTS